MNSTSFRSGFGRNPQGITGTDWTNLEDNNGADQVLAWCIGDEWKGQPNDDKTCGLMPGATHFVIYPGPTPVYDHGGYLTDTQISSNAYEDFSDDNGRNWVTASNSYHSIYTMFDAVLFLTW
jgi:hypothetical protein